MIVGHLSKLDLNDTSMLLYTYDQLKILINMVDELARDIFKALELMRKTRPILILPEGIKLSQIEEIEMNKMGWYRK